MKNAVRILTFIIALSSCIPEQTTTSTTSSGTTTENQSGSVNINYGRYLTDNPIILSGKSSFSINDSLATVLPSDEKFITGNQFLISSCSVGGASISECFEVRNNETSGYITATENRWAFGTSGDSFLQVQTFGSVRDVTQKWHEQVKWGYDFSNNYGYDSAFPSTLFTSSHRPFWYKEGKLKAYSNCGVENNAYYSPAAQSICLGHVITNPPLYFATDPTVTWHEMGHAFNHINMNFRHRGKAQTILSSSSLGALFYDEGLAINEGLADWYSFMMNGRTHFAEWALGRYLASSRPMSESDSLHAAGISETTLGRLSYPAFINYDPNDTSSTAESVHYTGQIMSHFLTAFYKSLQNSSVCGLNSSGALNLTLHLVQETLSELGDQTATGHGSLYSASYNVNLDPTNAYEWHTKVKSVNYRTFMQTFAKYFLRTVGNSSYNMCGSRHYDRDDFEKLVDSYGLLLYRTYNTNGNGITTGHSGTNTTVTPTNRVQSIFVQKEHLMFDPDESAITAYIVDKQSDIRQVMEGLILSGQISGISDKIDGNFSYNNGNGRISPAEVVGVSLNLYNNSNSTMAGVHVLANDWDHMKSDKPCNNLGDNWPASSAGAADVSTETGVEGDCIYTTRYNGQNTALEPAESLAPVCLVEIADDTSTQWKTQKALMTEMGMSPNECLGGSTSQHDCFVRAIKGADHSYFSKIEPKKTWYESLYDDVKKEGPDFNSNNVIFFEISPDVPPGTTFNCRMRARFSNCDDCYHDSTQGNDDYLDYEYSGAKPFKIINFQFVVLD